MSHIIANRLSLRQNEIQEKARKTPERAFFPVGLQTGLNKSGLQRDRTSSPEYTGMLLRPLNRTALEVVLGGISVSTAGDETT